MRQHFTAGFARQIQIEDEERRAFGKTTAMEVVKKFDGLLAIGNNTKLIRDVVLHESFAHQYDVAAVVFHQKNGPGAQALGVCAFIKREQ